MAYGIRFEEKQKKKIKQFYRQANSIYLSKWFEIPRLLPRLHGAKII